MPLVAVNVVVDEAKAARLADELADVPNGLPRVITRAVNKVGVAARTKIVRTISSEINVKQAELKRRNVDLRKANYDTLTATILVGGRRIPLIHFKAFQTRRGVTYAIRRGQRKLIPTAFKESAGTPVKMPSGHRGVFIRTGAPVIGRRLRRRGPGRGMAGLVRPRLPIAERFGPSVPEEMRNIAELSENVLDTEISENLEREIDTQAGLVLERHAPR